MPPLPKLKKLSWTHHSRAKMRQYGLSEQRVKRVIHSPRRVEEGIAPKTVAMMQIASAAAPTNKRSHEIWVMIQDVGSARKIISAWRYPGTTKPRDEMTKSFLKGEYEAYKSAGESG